MTIKEIFEKYGLNDYDYVVVDAAGFYWEECMGNWYAVGEFGWTATTEEVEKAGLVSMNVDDDDKIIYIYVNDSL